MASEKKHHKFNILVIGDTMTGKSALVTRYIHGTFKNDNASTVGIEYEGKVILGHPKSEADLRLALWDTAGQRIFRNLIKSYYLNSNGVLLVVDLGHRNTFESLNYWVGETKNLMDNMTPFVVVGNKNDLKRDLREVSEEEMRRFVGQYENMDYIETSALNGKNVAKAFEMLVVNILLKKSEEVKGKNDLKKMELELRKKSCEGDGSGISGRCGGCFRKLVCCLPR